MLTYFSENPENDLWRELLQFTYEANIKRYLQKNNKEIDEETVFCIAGSFLQAYEYYKSSKEANLQIAPLLLYYGSTNLLYGMTNLLNGKIVQIKNHGMVIDVSKTNGFIADTNIIFNSPDNGGIHLIAKSLGFLENLTEYGTWKLASFLDSIAEICHEYCVCYEKPCGQIAMIDVFNTPDGKVEKVYFDQNNKEKIMQLLLDVDGFSSSYLQPIEQSDILGHTYFVLWHKLNGKDISEISYSGQPYFRASHLQNSRKITIPTILNMYITLFALSSLCRYHPEKWSPFVLRDTTGERLLIEKFLFFARRMIPNIVLNKIVNSDVQYTSKKYEPNDTIKLVGEHQVQEMIKKEIDKRMEKEAIRKSKALFNDGGAK
ncbi:MAG: hypothetical protein IKN17_10180 [Ruminococcus sp.]|nr:hypothetical protein [Ruminococcus sp.]